MVFMVDSTGIELQGISGSMLERVGCYIQASRRHLLGQAIETENSPSLLEKNDSLFLKMGETVV